MAQSSGKDVRIFAFDVDGPIYSRDIDVDFALFLAKKGRFRKKAQEAFLQAMRDYEERNLSYPELCRQSIKAFAQGIERQNAAKIYWDAIEFVRENKGLFHNKGIQLLKQLSKRKNTKIVLISASPEIVISVISRVLGCRADYIRGAGYQTRKGKFTGIPLTGDLILFKQKALNFVEKWFRAKKENIVYYGNQPADLLSAQAAGVRFRPMNPSHQLQKLWKRKQQKKAGRKSSPLRGKRRIMRKVRK